MASTVVLGSRRFLHPGPLRWLRALGWMLLLGVLLSACYVLVAGGIMGLGAHLSGVPYMPGKRAEMIALIPFEWKVATTVVSVAICILLYAVLVRLAEGRWAAEYSLPHMPADLLGGVAAGAGMQALAIAGLALGGWVTITHQPITDWMRPIPDTIQSGFIEEMVFRLVILRLVWRAFGVWPALIFSAALFGAAHLNNPNSSWFAAICIAVEAGIMLATFYILTGRVWASVGVHMGWNFTQGWVFGAAVSGTDGFSGGPLSTQPVPGVPEWLSGGGFGPEASLAGLLVGTGFGLWLLVLAMRRGNLIGIDQRPGGDGGAGGRDDEAPEPEGPLPAAAAVATVPVAAVTPTMPEAVSDHAADEGGSGAAMEFGFSDPVM